MVDNPKNVLFLSLPPHFTLMLLVGIGLILGAISYLLIYGVAKYLSKYFSLFFRDTLKKLFKLPLLIFLPLVFVMSVLNNFPEVKFSTYLNHYILKPLLITAIAVFFMRIINLLENWVNKRFEIDKEYVTSRNRTVKTQLQFIRRLAIIIISLLTIAIILMNYKSMREISAGILASAGIVSAIVIFALQSTFSNILAGFQIAFTQPIRIGDTVIAENELGQVEEINLTYVVLKLWDKRCLVLPLNYFIQKPFQNWSRHASELIGTVFLYADYGIKINALRDELTKILEKNVLWDRRVNILQVTEASESALQIRVLVSAKDFGDLWNLRCEIREQLSDFLVKNFPSKLPHSRLKIHSSQSIDTHVDQMVENSF